jgi:hypothetical protein
MRDTPRWSRLGRTSSIEESLMEQCPICGEELTRALMVCRYCGEELPLSVIIVSEGSHGGGFALAAEANRHREAQRLSQAGKEIVDDQQTYGE